MPSKIIRRPATPTTSEHSAWNIPFQRTLYEPLLILCSLGSLFSDLSDTEDERDGSSVENTPEQTFRCFVNHIARIVDNVGPDTISAAALLNIDGRVTYVFGSNMRDRGELGEAKTFLRSIIDYVREQQSAETVVAGVLERVLFFHRMRLKKYIRDSLTQLKACINDCKPRDGELRLRFHCILGL